MAEVQKKRGLRIPHVYTIIFILMVLTAALTFPPARLRGRSSTDARSLLLEHMSPLKRFMRTKTALRLT